MTDKPFAGNNMMCGILVYYSLTCEGLSNEFHSLMSDFFVGDWLGSKEEFRWSDIVIAHSQHQQPESKIRGAVRDYALPWHHLKHIRECLNTQEEFKGLKLTATLKWRNLEWNKKSRQLCWILHSACSLHTGVKEVKWTLFFSCRLQGFMPVSPGPGIATLTFTKRTDAVSQVIFQSGHSTGTWLGGDGHSDSLWNAEAQDQSSWRRCVSSLPATGEGQFTLKWGQINSCYNTHPRGHFT